MGQIPLFQSIKILNPWCGKIDYKHGGQNKVAIEIAYIPHVCVHWNFWKVNGGMCKPYLNKTNTRTCPCKKMPTIKNDLDTWYNATTYLTFLHGIPHAFVPFYLIGCMSYRFQCGYGLEDHLGDAIDTRFNRTQLFGTFFNQEVVPMAQSCKNHLLPLLKQWRSHPWCM